jgi:hypothetical protein
MRTVFQDHWERRGVIKLFEGVEGAQRFERVEGSELFGVEEIEVGDFGVGVGEIGVGVVDIG